MTDSEQTVSTTRFGKRQVLFDTRLVAEPDELLFSPPEQNLIESGGDDIGRARVVMHRRDGLELVNRHYHRGGMMSWLGDIYFGIRAEASRSFREWCMLSVMRKQGLPVPVPVAASVISSGMFYTADLVMLRLVDHRTLADVCSHGEIDKAGWANVGRTIAQFHASNVYHADLNARNILLDAAGEVTLIDFDKGCFRQVGNSWRESNLARLKRSLDKFTDRVEGFRFTPDDWHALIEAYRTV